MNTKKILILAIVFGLLTSVVFYIATSNFTQSQDVPAVAPPNEQEEEVVEVEEVVEKVTIEIEEGKRAISIPVNEVQSVSSFVRPGSFVDVVALFPEKDGSSGQIILHNIKVLAVGTTLEDKAEYDEEGNEVEKKSEPYHLITLEVSPKDGTSLTLAREIGDITLMLRGEGDETSTPIKITSEQLIKGNQNK